jgi:Fic family protein
MQVVSGPIGREKIHYQAPPVEKIENEMTHFFIWFDRSLGSVEGLIRAALIHLWFVTIHPFDDGNGRLARALTDMALAQDDKQRIRYYSLSTQIMTERAGYYDILEKTQRGSGDVTEWLGWFLGCFTRAIERSEGIMNGVLSKSEFWKAHAQDQLTERQKKVINRLLDEGPKGFEGGLTTKKYASMTHSSRATAFRELDHLLELGIVQRLGQGRAVRYVLTALHEHESNA